MTANASAKPLAPRDENDVIAAVADARAAGTPLEIVGGATKRTIGRPMQTAATLSVARLSGITLYEPSELVLGAHAGTPLKDIEKELANNRQRLAFEPIDYRGLLASDGEPTVGEPTIGAVAAANLSGPRRIYAGAARDALLGIRMVTGRGEVIKSGGRVMKNVTGYDLVKLSAGSWGTLGVFTEVIFKVLPETHSERTLVFEGLTDASAVASMSAGLGSPFEVTGAAHMAAGIDGPAKTLLRIEGFDEQMVYRSGELKKLLRTFGVPALLADDASRALWLKVRDATFFAGTDEAVWRISVAPSHGAAIGAAATAAGGRVFYDWGGGLVWVAMPAASGDGGAAALRAVLPADGHATLVRAPETLRAAVDVFQPQPPAHAALTRGVKDAFDPDHILNPGRMYAGM